VKKEMDELGIEIAKKKTRIVELEAEV